MNINILTPKEAEYWLQLDETSRNMFLLAQKIFIADLPKKYKNIYNNYPLRSTNGYNEYWENKNLSVINF